MCRQRLRNQRRRLPARHAAGAMLEKTLEMEEEMAEMQGETHEKLEEMLARRVRVALGRQRVGGQEGMSRRVWGSGRWKGWTGGQTWALRSA